MPGVTLSRLWMLTGNVDKAFKFITFLIIIIALLGMIAMTIAGLNSRRREISRPYRKFTKSKQKCNKN